jgi:hypothetical protein
MLKLPLGRRDNLVSMVILFWGVLLSIKWAVLPCQRLKGIYCLRFRMVQHSKGKGKVHLRTGHEGPEGEQRYSSTLSLTSTLDEGGWSKPLHAALPPGMTRYPLYRRLDRPQGRSGRVLKISPPPGFDPRTVQLVASHYADYAIPAHWSSTVPLLYCRAL